ncbi:MAG TPA: PqqD family protein [Candidatus Acidoferrales bacterium]|jgi:hypothetical protein|nr:PqqD family protein [Candidatus Acidoferrales bacterium]
MNLDSIVYVQPDQVSCQLGDEHVILGLNAGVYFGLNPLGSFIWKSMTDAKPVRDIRDAVLAQYDVTPERCEQDLFDLLSRLSAERLVGIRDPLAS